MITKTILICSPNGHKFLELLISIISSSHFLFYITQDKAILIVAFKKYIRYLSFDRQKKSKTSTIDLHIIKLL